MTPSLGAWIEEDGARFRVWAPQCQSVDVVVESPQGIDPVSLESDSDGYFTGHVSGLTAGARYRYRLDGGDRFPDPATRFQPEGVHGPSEVINPWTFSWSDTQWSGRPLEEIILYELHVGAFSAEGSFEGVRRHLNDLKELGVTAVELMPVADFPGERNWGYDGVDLFAPARCYGRPDDLRRLVDTAHELGLAVFLDVVYNHLGPGGNYLGAYSPYYLSQKHKTPWGDAVNLDDEHCRSVRDFFIENALHWVHEYHIDGLRLDATHVMTDESPVHFVKELADRVRASLPEGRQVLVIAEDERNEVRLIRPPAEDGYGLDAVWSDDFYHQLRCLLTGEDESYFRGYSGSIEDIAVTVRQGWFFTGQLLRAGNVSRGTHPAGIHIERFIHFLQNHDQVGNRPLGDRLNHSVDPAEYRTASALLLLSPATPLVFMGQEWSAESPFCYFTDHSPELGEQVNHGRRKEFGHFKGFSDPEARQRIPDPQAPEAFSASKLDWSVRKREPHAGTLRLYQKLLSLRNSHPALRSEPGASFEVAALDEDTFALRREARDGSALLLVCRFKGGGSVEMTKHPVTRAPETGKFWQPLLTTEDELFASSPQPVKFNEDLPAIYFAVPSAILFEKG